MRILHIANEIVSTGNGIVNSAVDLACLQSEAGNEVTFISSGGGYADLLSKYKVIHRQVNMSSRSGWKFVRDLPKLRKITAEINPDIVHAHMMTGAVVMRLGRDFFSFGKYRLVTTVHNEWRLTSNLMQVGDGVIVLSENGKILFQKRGFPAHKMQVVRHGIVRSPRRRGTLETDQSGTPESRALSIITVAGLYKRKGIGDLIHAFGEIADEFPTASLHILGWGPDREYFEKQRAATRGFERIHFKGFVAQPHLVLREASVFVLASHTEAFPLAVAEAREAGCAIIATTVGGVPELLDHGRAGLLIPPREPRILAQALRRVLSNPRELQKWQAAATSNLDWLSCERMRDETIQVYRSLLTAPAAQIEQRT